MKKTGIMIIVMVVSVAGVLGKMFVNELYLQDSRKKAMEKCTSEYGQSEEDCQRLLDSTEQDLRNSQNQTGEKREESAREANRKAFIAGCSAQGQTEAYCQCGWERIIDKYTYDGFNEVKMKIADIGVEEMNNDPDLRQFSHFMTEEIPKLCEE